MANKITVSPEEQFQEIKVGVSEIIDEGELLGKLKRSFKTQTPLRVKLGADPSSPDIHIGHTVVLSKLKMLQDFGHHVIFIIGDFTARIGDPTGKSKTRPELSTGEVLANAETYQSQIFRILDQEKTEVVYNSNWLDKINPMDFIRLLATRTVQQLIVRDDFAKRFKENSPIYLHEFVYPILQGYDSLHLKADIEMGGTDQRFNLLLGREMQRQAGQEAQCLILMPLLEGLDGVMKMSKSLNNYIGISEEPREIFGKTMSITDETMLRFYDLLSRKGRDAILSIRKRLSDGTLHPMDAKKDLAQELVEHYWGKDAATEARKRFEETFSDKKIPTDLPEHVVKTDGEGRVNLVDISLAMGFAQTRSEVRRILSQNGIRIDGQPVNSEWQTLSPGKSYVMKQGKLKMCKLIVRI
ncbi:MAG: tyrosine--tRNA ligase [Deltaproteobacteria bacterium]|nr:tyrosine--tRNA ligase [Deltaproteobacteria bacterium]